MKTLVKKSLSAAGALVLGCAILATGATAASSAELYEHNNYVIKMWTGSTTNGVGLPALYNDKASSVKNVGWETYCENADCSGRTLTWEDNANALNAINTGLWGWETWNDRISGVQ